MAMPVVGVGEVRMGVGQWFVPVRMTVFFTGRHLDVMRMLVMFVVNMRMVVRHLVMDVCMFVALGQMQPDTEGHQRPGDDER